MSKKSLDTKGQKRTMQLKEWRKKGMRYPNPLGESLKFLCPALYSSMLIHKGEKQVSDRKKLSMSCQTITRCNKIRLKVTEYQGWLRQKQNGNTNDKGLITKCNSDGDLFHQLILYNTICNKYKYIFKFLVYYLAIANQIEKN